jgi:pimeloyl-ACP methyl ester carboxylesterase
MHAAGQGSTLVLLHGLGGTWEIWNPVLAPLEAQHRVVAVTLPGHHGGPAYDGESDATVAGLADQVLAMLRQQGIERAHVAGNSLGGWLAVELARRGFARSVTALSPAGAWRNDADYRAIATPFRIFYTLVGVMLFVVRPFARVARLRRTLMRQTMVHGERMTAREFVGALRAMAQTRILRGLLRTMGSDGPVAPLDAGQVPIRVAWGGVDAVIPYDRYGAPFVERIRGVEAITVPGVGHVPMYDDPERVVASILDVTRRVDRAAEHAESTVETAVAATSGAFGAGQRT